MTRTRALRGIFGAMLDVLLRSTRVVDGGAPQAWVPRRARPTVAEDWADAARHANPDLHRHQAYRLNCTHAVAAWDLRRRGYDVVARPLPKDLMGVAGRQHEDYLSRWAERATGHAPQLVTMSDPTAVRRAVLTAGHGARFLIRIVRRGTHLGHVFAAENVAGSVRFADPQLGVADVTHLDRLALEEISIVRLDTLIPLASIKDFVKEASS